jgi:hypothetical protein
MECRGDLAPRSESSWHMRCLNLLERRSQTRRSPRPRPYRDPDAGHAVSWRKVLQYDTSGTGLLPTSQRLWIGARG